MAHERAHEIFDGLTPQFTSLPDVALGRMFGTVGLGVRGKIFAFVSSGGDLVVKVGEKRAGELVTAGTAERMEMRGREMREWLRLRIEQDELWAPLMNEAHDFVDSITPH